MAWKKFFELIGQNGCPWHFQDHLICLDTATSVNGISVLDNPVKVVMLKVSISYCRCLIEKVFTIVEFLS